ncbi:sensor histidine kinase [Streptomonospora wellingtoniae]|uniref:histidine kinase n=1 Tax=Streptomonospora wellingtoniae TaxID=3075544 RepID=A0ABU2KWL1_9ACTN|nr:histidine kinase [Streptomonospora sp. DSM 45055]MDT0303685.1 histidine kinase [Streptomonospora sp. DSM 45055]
MGQPGAAAARAGKELLRPLSGRPTRRTAVLDLLLWAVLCLPLLRGLAAVVDGVRAGLLETPGQAAAAVVLLGAAVAASRPYPLAAALLALAVSEAVAPNATFAAAVLCYLLGRRDPRAWLAGSAFAASAAVLAVRMVLEPQLLLDVPGMGIAYVFTLVLPWMLGSYRRQRANLDDAGWERARQLQREQRIAAEEARLRERSRIAQDMHDSLGHELSLIALRAGALELAPDLAERHRTAAGGLRESATTATERLREIVGVLRESGRPGTEAPTAPPGEEIADVVERARRSGVDVALERSGLWDGVAPMVDRAAHRVVQEGLTNATKHAPGAPVRVALERAEHGTVAKVANGPPPEGGPSAADAPGGGRGLIGLAERVRLAGGTLETGERGGGFEIVAHFPSAGGTAAAESVGEPESDAPDEHRRAVRRSLRRRTAAMAVAAVVLVALGVLAAVGSEYLRAVGATLPPSDYRSLRVGAPAAQVEPLLPGRQYEPAAAEDDSEAAERSDCRYYRSAPDIFGGGFGVYRLCFDGGGLVSKDTLPGPRSDTGV